MFWESRGVLAGRSPYGQQGKAEGGKVTGRGRHEGVASWGVGVGAGQDLPCGLPPSASEQRMERGRGLWVLLRTPVVCEILPEWGHHHGPPRQRLCGPWVGEVASGYQPLSVVPALPGGEGRGRGREGRGREGQSRAWGGAGLGQGWASRAAGTLPQARLLFLSHLSEQLLWAASRSILDRPLLRYLCRWPRAAGGCRVTGHRESLLRRSSRAARLPSSLSTGLGRLLGGRGLPLYRPQFC